MQEQSTEGFSKWAILHILHVKWNMRLQDLLCYNAYCLICTITNTYLFITFIILLCTAGHVQHVFMFLICFILCKCKKISNNKQRKKPILLWVGKQGMLIQKKPHFLEEKGVILTRLGNFFRSLCITNILKIRPFYYLKWCTVSLSCHSIKAFSEGDGHEPPILP